MTTRAQLDMGEGPKIKSYAVAASGSTVEGRPVSLINSDQEVTLTAAGAACHGIALETVSTSGARVQVLVSEGDTIVKVKVGTGGATRGKHALVVADGLTDAPTLGAGTVLRNIIGTFCETGVVGDVVGFKFRQFAAVSV